MDRRDPSERVVMEKKPTNTYPAAREHVDRQIAQIQALLARHASKHAADTSNWGYPGDLAHVTEILDDAIEFLGGTREVAVT